MKKILLIFFIFLKLTAFAQEYNVDSLYTSFKIAKTDTQKLYILNTIIDAIVDDEAWIPYNRQMYDLATKALLKNNNDERSKYILLRAKSDAISNFGSYFDNKGETDSAIYYYLAAIEIDRKTDHKISLSQSLEGAGKNFIELGDYNKALGYYNEALTIVQKENDLHALGRVYNSLGLFYRVQGDKETALSYYNKTYSIRTKLRDKFGIGEVLVNIAGVEPDLRKKLGSYRKSLAIMKTAGHKVAVASILNNMGGTYLELNKTDSALMYFNMALNIRRAISDKAGMSKSLYYIAKIMAQQKKYDTALEYAIESYDLSLVTKNPGEIIITTSLIKDLYLTKKDYVNAFKFLSVYTLVKDSATNINKGKEFYRQKVKFEYEQKDFLRKEEEVRKDAEFKAKSRQQKIIIFSFLVIVIIISVFSYFLFARYRLTRQQKTIIETQKNEVDIKQKEILDSIHYAKRIQTTLLAHKDFIDANVPDNFVFFQPKDIVSGDFYWATKKDNSFYLAVCDSTGHGVPGAFMSLLNISFLNEAINEKNILQPNDVLNQVRSQLNKNMEGSQDGMDAILVKFQIKNSELEIAYSAANNEPVLISENKLMILPKDKMPVGKGERTDSFSLHLPEVKKGDTLYFYTDGFIDQFGGPRGKKFKSRQLNDFLLSISEQSMTTQHEMLQNKFAQWKGDLEQVDDICIIGIRI
ncbi:MAG: tetratricopeptide repeat protein [Bacteroidetes bacterium]|nr:tetratricopeptide repeat protein [Bacteroidota bacterium]